MTKRFAITRSRQSENHLANLPLLLIDRTACENAVRSPLGCLSFLCLHNRREDMSRLEPGMTRQQVVGLLGRPDVVRSSGAYEQLEYTHRLITGWSWDRSDFKVILKDGRVVEFGHGEVRDRSPQVVYVHSDTASQPERPTIYPYSRQLIWQSSRNPTDPALLEIERRGLSATRSRAAVMTGLRESQVACRASRCSESSALSAAFWERRTASNTASGEISLMHLRPVRHTPL